MTQKRLWVIRDPRAPRSGPDLVVWDAPSATEILHDAEWAGWKVIGPFVLETADDPAHPLDDSDF